MVVGCFLRVVVPLQAPGFVFLQNHDRTKTFDRRVEATDVPEAAVFAIAEEVASDRLALEVLAAGDFLQDVLFDRTGVGSGGVIEGRGEDGEQQTEDEEGGEQPENAAPRTEDGDELVAARHLGEGVKNGQEQADREAHQDDFRDPEEVKFRDARKRGFVLEESRCILAQVEDQPDGDKPQHAVKERLEHANEDVSVEDLHSGRPGWNASSGEYPAAAARHQSV